MARSNFDLKGSHTLSVESSAIPLRLGQPALIAVRLSGQESVNGLFEYRLRLKTPDALNSSASGAIDFNLDDFIGREISCTIQLDGMGTFLPGAVGAGIDHIGAGARQINALITAATLWGEEGRHVQYELTLSPWLHFATLNTNTKIYQNKTAVQILDELLGSYPFPVEKRLMETYSPRDYQTQYNESDHAFFERLTQEYGINYFFEHSDGKHRLVLIDNLGAYKKNPSAAYQEVQYHPPGWKTEAEYIHSFVPRNQLTSGRYSTREYDYTRPRADLGVSRAEPRPTGQAGGEVYQWHDGTAGSHYAQPRAGTAGANDPREEGRQFALVRMQALRTHGARAKASGNLRGMVPGCSFELVKHPREKANTEYLILETQFLIEDVAQDSQIKDAASDRKQGWRVEVDFTAHPMSEPLRPALTQKKPVTGTHSARVVGPVGQNVWTDEYGRIKVQFPWDRIGANDADSSCWVRVMSQWAGNQLGATNIPRIGQEVIVDFLGGDPDLPVCIGSVHNQDNLPPWHLPNEYAISGLRSRELTADGGNAAGGRSNHLILDDTHQSIQAQLKSDHQSSSLSLGHITRIEDNAGRKDYRGHGFELRTDGHGVLRAKDGMLITTEARSKAKSHVLDSSETLQRLAQARDLHESLAGTAQGGGAQEGGQDQSDVTAALEKQNNEIKGSGGGGGDGQGFPELEAPHLVLASPAGIETTTSGSTHIASGEHVALTSGKHTSVSAGDSILATAKRAVRVFAYETGIRAISALADIDVKALKQGINLLAKLDINITANRVTITAKEEVLVNGGGSYTLWKAGLIENGSPGPAVFYTSAMNILGPRNKPGPTLPSPPSRTERKQESQKKDELEVFLSTFPEAGYAFGNEPYKVYKGGAEFGRGITGPDGRMVIKNHVPGTPAYTIRLSNGAEFNMKVSKKLDPASKEQQLSNDGFRGPSGTAGRSDDYPSPT